MLTNDTIRTQQQRHPERQHTRRARQTPKPVCRALLRDAGACSGWRGIRQPGSTGFVARWRGCATRGEVAMSPRLDINLPQLACLHSALHHKSSTIRRLGLYLRVTVIARGVRYPSRRGVRCERICGSICSPLLPSDTPGTRTGSIEARVMRLSAVYAASMPLDAVGAGVRVIGQVWSCGRRVVRGGS